MSPLALPVITETSAGGRVKLCLRGAMPAMLDGYESVAEDFVRARRPGIGPRVVLEWAKGLPPGASILDLGCGHGVPTSEALLQAGYKLYGVDASPTLVSKFRQRFPETPVECSPVEDSLFFSRTYDAAVAWGLMFLLPAEAQRSLISKVARALDRQGQFLFTSPRQACTWADSLTGLPSISLGHEVYEQELAAQGLVLVGNDEDEGENYYYFVAKD